MAATYQGLDVPVDREQLAGILREAGGAEHDFLPADRIAGYLSRLEDGILHCIAAARDEELGAALLYSRFGPLYPVPGSFLRLEGLYVEEVVVTRGWRHHGWSRKLLARLRELEGSTPDIYIDCDARNEVSMSMMRSAGYTHVADYDDPDRSEPDTGARTTLLFRHPGRPATDPKEG